MSSSSSVRLASRVFIVTGGSSGIGLAVARRLAADGAAVVLGARRKDVGEEAARSIRDAGGQAVFTPADVSVEADAALLVQTAIKEFGRLDGAFNNAGGVNAAGRISDIDGASWEAEIAQNVTSVFNCLKHQIPALLERGGSIVNNASNMGVVALPEVAPYVAAKHAVVGLTRATALEVATQGVRINAITTGGVDTPLARNSMLTSDEAVAHIESLHPVNRIAQPEEIAPFVAFLLSAEASFITGAALAIDGGFTTR
ncbi:SDR family oxidoreductase [Streptomyces sp. NPDC005963]|uniref:SDR family NAD(P)-dependent oxidoreductase n=1 Tax=Streptomyces sp. NPDC005963 TaxID=3156721 RepID=UPI0033C66FA4